MSEFKDHFSGHADRYETFRPTYPAALFDYVASLVGRRELAWDCATGNGQAATQLAKLFGSVIATDASQKQIEHAHPHAKVRYEVAPAEHVPIPDGAVDLVTVAQALHWFDLPKFYAEVKRVSAPGGAIAVWCYQLHTVSPEVDAVVHHLYTDIVGDDWPPERRLVEDGYRSLPFPFEELQPPALEMAQNWDLHHLLGYLGTWSSVQRYRKQRGSDPIAIIRQDLEAAWGDPQHERQVVWPLHLRVGRIDQHH